MSRLRPIYLLVSIFTFAIGIGLAFVAERSGWPYSIDTATVPEPNAQWYENGFVRKTFTGDIKAVYVGSFDDPYTSDGCFEIANHTNQSVYFWGDGINSEGVVVKQDGRIVDVTSTPEPSLLEFKPGESHGSCVPVPRNSNSFTVQFPVLVGHDRIGGTVTVTVGIPYQTYE
jgi:hypothetical protein